MNDRVRDYIDLHIKLERTLPKLPDDATPQQIDRNQRTFEVLMRNARATAKPGDIFTREARPVIMRLLATIFGGSDGRQLKASIMDENPAGATVAVNGRYPHAVPLSTIPAQVLQTLPRRSSPPNQWLLCRTRRGRSNSAYSATSARAANPSISSPTRW